VGKPNRSAPAAASQDFGLGIARNDESFAQLYDKLRGIAARYLAGGRHQTLQPTALVHELLVKCAEDRELKWNDRTHFLASAAQAMRWILLDYAKAKRREKRGGGAFRVTFHDAVAGDGGDFDMIALDDVLNRLKEKDERMARIVELRFFGGLSNEEVAQALKISVGTVKRDWTMARAWLFREMGEAEKK